MEIKNLHQTKTLAEILARNIQKKGALITLIGEIGAGKTAFARFLIKALGVEKEVTSPSFVILNEYSSKFFPIYHFDLYRLEKNGINSIEQELYEYCTENVLTIIEWADFGAEKLPYDKIQIKISFNKNDSRIFELTACGEYYKQVIKKTTEEFYEHFNN